MIPPLVRRCPNCGHVAAAVRFSADGGAVACPRCGRRFRPLDAPRLK